jgi:hypothetical protein
MDFKKQKKFDLKDAHLIVLAVLGGGAACTAELLTFPFDNIKTRMQMNGKEGMVYIYLIFSYHPLIFFPTNPTRSFTDQNP